MRLLLVEDEEVLGRFVAMSLGAANFTVDWVRSGGEALAASTARVYDLILLDLGLPDMLGEVLLRQLRSARVATPVIVLTARGLIEDRVAMLDLGADDYMVKPYDVVELQARARALVRRAAQAMDPGDVQRVGPLELYQASRSACWHGAPITLTAKEYDVLETLVVRRPRVVSRAQLEEALYGSGEQVESNSIEVFIHFLRRKFTPGLILTVRGRGYQLCSEDALRAQAPAQGAGG